MFIPNPDLPLLQGSQSVRIHIWYFCFCHRSLIFSSYYSLQTVPLNVPFSPLLQAPFLATTKTLRRHSWERRRRSWPAAPPSTTTTTPCSPHPTTVIAAGTTAVTAVRVWKRPAQCKMCRLLNGRIPYLINSNSRVGAMRFTAPRTGLLAMAVPVSLVAVHTGSLPCPPSLPFHAKPVCKGVAEFESMFRD